MKESTGPSAVNEPAALAEELRPALLKLGRHLHREAQKAGVSALDAQIIGTVWRNPGIGVSGLAEAEQMSSPSMSAHVKRLEAAGLLARDATTDGDQRRTRLVLTAKAKRSAAAVRQSRNDWLASRLTHLDAGQLEILGAAAPVLRLLTDMRL
jgi:DNA-binding MarR family transcriptional regulator